MARQPIADPVRGLRQRRRADGTWRIWWEPSVAERKAGVVPVELSAERLAWSVREAARLNAEAGRVARGERKKPSGRRTVEALAEEYRRSKKFLALPLTTRRSYAEHLSVIVRKWGSQPVVEFTKPVMHAWYQALYDASGPWQALNVLRMASILFGYAELIGWRAENTNPCLRLGMEKPKGRSRSASWAEIDAAIAAAARLGRRGIHTALHLAIFHGQRQTDVLAAMPEDFRVVELRLPGAAAAQPVWVWSFLRSKRGNAGAVPVHPEAVPVVIAARAAAAAGPGPMVWDEATGKLYTKELFFKRWEEVRAEAAKTVPSVASLQWRDLRRTFAVMARQGAGKDDVADVLGNSADSDPYLAGVYMPARIETAARAVLAIARPDRPRGEKP